MSKKIWIVTLALFTACTATTGSPSTTPNPTTNAYVLVIAHRGGAGLKPENTLSAFANALALKVDYLEMDAHLTKDGIPVVIHDPTLERTTDSVGQVSNYPLNELQKFNAAAKSIGAPKESIPTFAQVLDLAKPTNVKIEVEIKVSSSGRYVGIEQKMIDEIVAHEMTNRVQISSFDFAILKTVKSLNPQIKTVALMSLDYFRTVDLNTPKTTIDQMVELKAEYIAVNKDLLNTKLVQEARSRGIMVEVWTVDTPDDMKKFVSWGVDGIISNRPDKLKEVLGK